MPRPICLVLVATIVACGGSDVSGPPQEPPGASPPTVALVDRSFGNPGDAGLVVSIRGTGFDQGSRASWELAGAPASAITVRSTAFVSAGELRATIDISTAAPVAIYGVVVTTGAGQRSSVTGAFEVTTAVPVPGMVLADAVNERGEIGGATQAGAAIWKPGLGPALVKDGGRLNGLSEDGATVAGSVTGSTIGCCDGAFVAELSGAAWRYTVLPRDAAAIDHRARGLASSSVSGACVAVAGSEVVSGNRQQAILWIRSAGGWDRTPLPFPPGGTHDSYALAVARANGPAVGILDDRAAVWTLTSGTWGVASIGALGSRAWAISRDGAVIVGYVPVTGATQAARWTLAGGTWTPIPLPGGCTEAKDIDDSGRILVSGCPSGNRRVGGVIAPPYGSSDLRLLAGGGANSGAAANVTRMSARGTWITGTLTTASGEVVVVRWPTPF